MKCKIHGCEEKVLHKDLCILHLELPDDESSETFKRIEKLKIEKLENEKKVKISTSKERYLLMQILRDLKHSRILS
ncbi:MAG: hypothetical protein CIT03_08595 [Methanobacterium sp.]|nr:MAG: hypothetical protein CIT03_08595 [Methanobacterium sp.]